MKRLYMILAMLAIVATINATKIYHGNSTYVGNVVYTWDGKHLYQGRTANTYIRVTPPMWEISYTLGTASTFIKATPPMWAISS